MVEHPQGVRAWGRVSALFRGLLVCNPLLWTVCSGERPHRLLTLGLAPLLPSEGGAEAQSGPGTCLPCSWLRTLDDPARSQQLGLQAPEVPLPKALVTMWPRERNLTLDMQIFGWLLFA